MSKRLTQFNPNKIEKVCINGHKCFECKIPQNKLRRKLCCHHINYNKRDNHLLNLITLCHLCHLKTNYSRDDWQRYFKTKTKPN